MHGTRVAQGWWVSTLGVGVFALVAQLVLVISGASVLVEEDPPSLGDRLLRYVSYFTIQSNVAVVLSVLPLVRRPGHDTPGWRVLRLDAIVGITITGVVHWFLLRPLLDLSGWSWATDRLLHLVVPFMAVTGWLVFGPRPRVTLRVVLLGLVWPVAWLGCTLVMGVVTGWYPYPFLDVPQQGAGPVAVACVGIAFALFVVSALVWLADRRLPHRREELAA